MLPARDVGRRKDEVVTAPAINSAAHRINEKSPFKGSIPDGTVDLERRFERSLDVMGSTRTPGASPQGHR